MKIQIFNNVRCEEYRAFVKKWDLKLDIYYHPDFLKVEAEKEGGIYEIFCAATEKDVFLYPYIRLPFKENGWKMFSDIVSPYGYAGPFCTSSQLLEMAEDAFTGYCSETGVISEFIRYHYLTTPDMFFKKNIKNEKNRIVIVIDLNQSWESLRHKWSPTNRNIVSKLEKEGYSFDIDWKGIHLEEFSDMYRKTMKYVNANDYYFFDNQFLEKLFSYLEDGLCLARVTKSGTTYCSALFFISGGVLTYYLSSRNLEFPNIPATNLLLSEMIKYGISKKLRWFNLGGGRTSNEDDSLLNFKKQFSKTGRDFYIGKRIHDNGHYTELINKFIQQNTKETYRERQHLLHFYRNI